MVWGMQFHEKAFNPFGHTLARSLQTSSIYGVQGTVKLLNAKKNSQITPSAQLPSSSPRPDGRLPGGPKGNPTALDKLFLVGSGQFKSASEIPTVLEGDVILRARSWGRIRVNIGFLFLAAAGGGLMVYFGKQAAARGESLENQNLEWHRKIKEEYDSQQGRTPK